jgi:hypothetical protein
MNNERRKKLLNFTHTHTHTHPIENHECHRLLYEIFYKEKKKRDERGKAKKGT